MKLPRMAVAPPAPLPRGHRPHAGPGITTMGTWSGKQINIPISQGRDWFESRNVLVFAPSTADGSNCDEIAFVQSARSAVEGGAAFLPPAMSARATNGHWAIDRKPNRQHGWFGLKDDGTFAPSIRTGNTLGPKNAIAADFVKHHRTGTQWRFETCAICKAGQDVNKIYGCKTWGFDVDNQGVLMPDQTLESSSPSADWGAAVAAWNTQAMTQGAGNLQSPQQQPLPMFSNFS